jgi:hypothetical protein
VEVPAAIGAHWPTVVEPNTANPPIAEGAKEEAPGPAVGKAPVLQPHFTLLLNCAKADPDAGHVAVILPSARSRETLGEAGRGSSHNLCVAIRLQYHRAVGEKQREETSHLEGPKLVGPSAKFWADELGGVDEISTDDVFAIPLRNRA